MWDGGVEYRASFMNLGLDRNYVEMLQTEWGRPENNQMIMSGRRCWDCDGRCAM